MKLRLPALLLFISFISCTDDILITDVILEEQWIEVSYRVDTLTFNIIDGSEFMTLDRGNEMRNGFLLPETGSGSYDYKLLEREISIRWHLSSNSLFTEHYFELAGNKFQIGNFFNDNATGNILTFERID
jgi:hypothetical protein